MTRAKAAAKPSGRRQAQGGGAKDDASQASDATERDADAAVSPRNSTDGGDAGAGSEEQAPASDEAPVVDGKNEKDRAKPTSEDQADTTTTDAALAAAGAGAVAAGEVAQPAAAPSGGAPRDEGSIATAREGQPILAGAAQQSQPAQQQAIPPNGGSAQANAASDPAAPVNGGGDADAPAGASTRTSADGSVHVADPGEPKDAKPAPPGIAAGPRKAIVSPLDQETDGTEASAKGEVSPRLKVEAAVLNDATKAATSAAPEAAAARAPVAASASKGDADAATAASAGSSAPNAGVISTLAQAMAHVGNAPASHGTGPASQATEPAAAEQQPSFVEANHANIVAGVRAQLLPHGGTMQLRLDPPELGALQVTVEMRDGTMSATFQTSNDDATRLLGHSLHQLKGMLEAQGVSVDRLQVQQAPRDPQAQAQDGRDGRNGSGQQQQGQQQQQGDPQARQQEEQRRAVWQRMWQRINGGRDPVDVKA